MILLIGQQKNQICNRIIAARATLAATTFFTVH
jgi:hypothetical protein